MSSEPATPSSDSAESDERVAGSGIGGPAIGGAAVAGPAVAGSGVSDFGVTGDSELEYGETVSSPLETSERVRLARGLRRMVRSVVAAELAPEDLSEAADRVEELAAMLEDRAGPAPRMRSHPDPGAPPEEFFPTSPVIGFANPLAPPVLVDTSGGEVHARAVFDEPYEGPPTCVHGGVIAMVFDELLGAANIVAGQPGMTGTLTIRYRRPTPLGTELQMVARCTGREGRKIRAWGAIYHGDVMTAEAEGIFVEVPAERFAALAEGHLSRDGLSRAAAEAERIGLTGPPGAS